MLDCLPGAWTAARIKAAIEILCHFVMQVLVIRSPHATF